MDMGAVGNLPTKITNQTKLPLKVLRLNWKFEDEQKQTGNFAEELKRRAIRKETSNGR